MRYPEKSNSYRQKAKWLLPGDGGRKKGELPFNRYRDSVLQDKKKKVLWMDGGVAGTTTCMYLVPLIGTRKKVKMVNFV